MRLSPWLVAGVLLAGCGESEEEVDFDTFFTKAETTYCEWAARCRAFEDAATCGEVVFFDVYYPLYLFSSGQLVGDESRTTVEYLRASHAAGRIAFDEVAARTCLDHVAARGCERPESLEADAEAEARRAACATIFRGTLGDGEVCGLALECGGEIGTASCFQDSCSDMCCSGQCFVPEVAAEGESCALGKICGAGRLCTWDESRLDYFCTAGKRAGEACQGGECEAGTNCVSNVCEPRKAIGEPCEGFSGYGCQAGSICVDPDSDGVGVCEGYKAIGEACLYYGHCRDIDAACDMQVGKCVAVPGAGEPCTPEGLCVFSASCDFSTMTCLANAGVGEPCGTDMASGAQVECGGDLQCNGGSLQLNECLIPASYACPLP